MPPVKTYHTLSFPAPRKTLFKTHEVLRHLDTEKNGLVEIREMAAAVRNIRRYEAAIRAAREDHGKSGSRGGYGGQKLAPYMHSATDGRGRLADGGTTGNAGFPDAGGKRWDGDGGGCYGGTMHLRDPRVCGVEGPFSPLEVG